MLLFMQEEHPSKGEQLALASNERLIQIGVGDNKTCHIVLVKDDLDKFRISNRQNVLCLKCQFFWRGRIFVGISCKGFLLSIFNERQSFEELVFLLKTQNAKISA